MLTILCNKGHFLGTILALLMIGFSEARIPFPE
jgi:hypothetical protein